MNSSIVILLGILFLIFLIPQLFTSSEKFSVFDWFLVAVVHLRSLYGCPLEYGSYQIGFIDRITDNQLFLTAQGA